MLSRDDDHLWQAVKARDGAFDGQFVYAVRTTGVYCRPSCPSRPKRRENVSFHADATAAQAAGFRACLRCRPQETRPDAALDGIVAFACQRIEGAETEPSLADLSAAAGYSPFHFQRLFKERVGLTPKQFAKACRKARLRQRLTDAASVTDAIYAAGYGASSRAYEDGAALGMTPQAFRRGAGGERIVHAMAASSLGPILVAATGRGICMIEFGDEAELVGRLSARFPGAELTPGDAGFAELVGRVVALVDAPGSTTVDLPLDIRGTAFQERVWRALTQIPAGETVSYAALAERIGQPRAARAVARACAGNGIAVAIPCHRVVRGDGDISGYRWGVARKRALLDREALNPERPAPGRPGHS